MSGRGFPATRKQARRRYYDFSVFVFICLKNLIKSPTGRSLIAIRDSEISAKSMGINVEKTKLISFGLSSGITGLGGALFAHFSGFVSPDSFNILLSIQLLIIVFVSPYSIILPPYITATLSQVSPTTLIS